MRTKTIIERELKFNRKYIYLDITRGNIMDGQCTTCDNCGKLISNMVHVKDYESKKAYTIGTDCAETLSLAKCLYNNGTQTDFYVDIYAYNKAARVATELRKGKEYQDNGFTIHVETDKGKKIDAYLSDVKRYFPELL